MKVLLYYGVFKQPLFYYNFSKIILIFCGQKPLYLLNYSVHNCPQLQLSLVIVPDLVQFQTSIGLSGFLANNLGAQEPMLCELFVLQMIQHTAKCPWMVMGQCMAVQK